MKIVKSLKGSGLFLKGVTRTIENKKKTKKQKKQRGGFLIFQGDLLSGDLLSGEIIRAGDEAIKKEKSFNLALLLD